MQNVRIFNPKIQRPEFFATAVRVFASLSPRSSDRRTPLKPEVRIPEIFVFVHGAKDPSEHFKTGTRNRALKAAGYRG